MVIQLENVKYKYPLANTYALNDISFNFEKGKFYGIIGENGGGKTTLCNLIRGLIPHFYRGELEGKTLVMGKNIQEVPMEEFATQIGFVFQNPFNQISGIKTTVFEEIAMGLENLGVPKSEIIEKVLNVCREVGIEELMEKNPNELSGGQRQRVAFASIIVMNSDLLVIDEPTSQLDPKGTEDVFKIIKQLKDSGKTIILVEHQIDLIAEYCDEIIVLQNGKIVHTGETHEILSNLNLLDKGANLPPVSIWGHDMAKIGKSLPYIPITVFQAVKAVNTLKEKEVL